MRSFFIVLPKLSVASRKNRPGLLLRQRRIAKTKEVFCVGPIKTECRGRTIDRGTDVAARSGDSADQLLRWLEPVPLPTDEGEEDRDHAQPIFRLRRKTNIAVCPYSRSAPRGVRTRKQDHPPCRLVSDSIDDLSHSLWVHLLSVHCMDKRRVQKDEVRLLEREKIPESALTVCLLSHDEFAVVIAERVGTNS